MMTSGNSNISSAPTRAILLVTASISALAALTPVAASAQATGSDAATVGEIVVTAQKRAQNLQDVPIAVTAVTSDTLQANRVVSVMDLTGLAPGLVARQNAGSLGSPSFSMRGIFASASLPSQDRQISIYVDGVYLGGTRGAVFDLPDLQRIEVLRGPQGTLFGRNATAGAVSVVTRDPSGEFAVRQEVTVGNYSQLRTRTSVDLPAMGPLSAYVTYVHDERRGDTRNLGAGTTFDRTSPWSDVGVTRSPKWLGSRNFENVFAAVKFEPTDKFSMVYKFDRSSGVNAPEARVATVINPSNATGAMLLSILAVQPTGGGRFGPVVLNPSNKRLKAVNNAWTQEGYLRTYGHNLTTQWKINDNLSVRNITAYRHATTFGPSTIAGLSGLELTAGAVAAYAAFARLPVASVTPLIGSYFAGQDGNAWGKSWQESSETQLNYDSDFVTLTVGGVWYHAKEMQSGLPKMATNFTFRPVPTQLPLGGVQENVATTVSLAAYAQSEFHVTPELDLVLGARVTQDKKKGSLTTGGTFVGDRNTSGDITGAVTFPWSFKKTKPTYSVGVNYKPSPDLLVYGKYSTGFLSGGAIGSLTFEPETVKSVEAGVKSDLLDGRLRLNAAIYAATYRHTQAAQGGANVGQPQLGVVVIDNGSLKARGIELEAVARPIGGLTLGASVGYTDAELKNPNPVVAQGNRYLLSNNPKWIGSVNAQYETEPLYQDAHLVFRIDANYQGKFRAISNPDIERQQPVFAPFEFMAARWIVNSRVSLRDIKIGSAEAEVALWARNLFNNKDALYTLVLANILHNSSFQPARTYGVDFIVEF